MKVLAIGASGYVGGLILPVLKQSPGLELAVYDLSPPADDSIEYIPGDVGDRDALAHAARTRDAVIYLAMGRRFGPGDYDLASAYTVNLLGLHLALDAAVEAGVRRFVHTSTGSVYGYRRRRMPQRVTEDTPCQPRDVYGLTKYLAEQVCEHVARVHGLSVLTLRLWKPMPDDRWEAEHRRGFLLPVRAKDLARAYVRALEIEHTGFDAILIAGDRSGQYVSLDKARRLLAWEPSPLPDPPPA